MWFLNHYPADFEIKRTDCAGKSVKIYSKMTDLNKEVQLTFDFVKEQTDPKSDETAQNPAAHTYHKAEYVEENGFEL